MKKLLTFLVITALILLLAACGSVTCQSCGASSAADASYCASCGAEIITPTNHTHTYGDDGICTKCDAEHPRYQDYTAELDALCKKHTDDIIRTQEELDTSRETHDRLMAELAGVAASISNLSPECPEAFIQQYVDTLGDSAETREKALKDWTAQYQSKKDELDKKEHQLFEEIDKAEASITSCTAEITRLDDQYKTDLATLKAKYGF